MDLLDDKLDVGHVIILHDVVEADDRIVLIIGESLRL